MDVVVVVACGSSMYIVVAMWHIAWLLLACDGCGCNALVLVKENIS